jgi:hypothetical protein
LAPPDSRFGRLQRGRGAGFVAALEAGRAAVDDVLRCAIEDPRVDRLLEARGRYLGELVAALDAPVEPLLAALHDADGPRLGHEVLAAAAACGHGACRRVVEDDSVPLGLRATIAEWLVEWEVATPAALSAPLRARVMEGMLSNADSVSVAPRLRRRPALDLATNSVEELLEQARTARLVDHEALHDALAARRSARERAHLFDVLRREFVHGRVQAAARALGAMNDDRALELCERFFARSEEGGALTGVDRMRRSALADDAQRLPGTRQLALARSWHPRGGYFAVVAGMMMEEYAEPDDRLYLEQCVERDLEDGTGWCVISELDALSRLADERSAPLLSAVAEQAAYSHARRRAVRGLAVIASERGAARPAVREALWDCEDEAAADACAFLPDLDDAATARVRSLSTLAVADMELRERASRRLGRR